MKDKKNIYKKQLKDLQEQTVYEKKLHMHTIEVLENKISELIAENTDLKTKHVRSQISVQD